MSLLQFDLSKCVRTSNKLSSCDSCATHCVTQTISLDNHLPSYTPNDCIKCGGCIGVCPTSAFSLDDFDTINYIFEILEQQKEVLSCQESIPCLAMMSVEELLSLALLYPHKTLLLDKSNCQECEIASFYQPKIEAMVAEVNFTLQALLVEKRVVFQEIEHHKKAEEESSRRAFLEKFTLTEAIKARQKFQNEVDATQEETIQNKASVADIQKIRNNKDVPKKRKLLLMALKQTQLPQTLHKVPQEEISFISQKQIDPKLCTNCQMCYRICPTQALSTNAQYNAIYFDAYKCTKCNSCHDVCESDAIILQNIFELEQLFHPKKETLVTFNMRRCDECNMPYVFYGDNLLCPRCSIEEEEAMNLWGIDPTKRSF